MRTVCLTVLDFAIVKEGGEMVISKSSSFPDRIIPSISGRIYSPMSNDGKRGGTFFLNR